jgi:hypothetical protein
MSGLRRWSGHHSVRLSTCNLRAVIPGSQLDAGGAGGAGGVKRWPAIKLWRIIHTVSCGGVTEVTAYRPARCSNSVFLEPNRPAAQIGPTPWKLCARTGPACGS